MIQLWIYLSQNVCIIPPICVLLFQSFSSFDKSPLAQIQQVLQDKGRLIKRTQLKRTAYKVLGKVEMEDKKEEEEEVRKSVCSFEIV